MATSLNGIKAEEEVKIKAEADTDSPSGGFVDDDEYEDTGELQFPKVTPNGWLTRLPKDLWDGLEKLRDDDEVHIGDVKVWSLPNGGQKLRLVIDKSVPNFDMIPKEYDLQIVNRHPRNTFIFSEKNLPGYRPLGLGRNRLDRMRQDALRKTDGSRVEKPKPRGPKTIPKHTAYAALPDHEVHCTPRENDEWRRIQARKKAMEAAAHKPQIANEPLEVLFNESLGIQNRQYFENFIPIANEKKHRPQEFKAARIEESLLLDLLAQLFKKYKYWSMRALKDATKQPEAYLREVLGKIGLLVKSGPAANHYMLNPEIAAGVYMTDEELATDDANVKQEDIAPDVEPGADADLSGVDDDDENLQMEDVV